MLTEKSHLSRERVWTYDELVDCLPESNQPTELWQGALVISPGPAPNHQRVVGRSFRRFDDFVSATALGEVFVAPLDVVFSQEQTVQPDIVFVANRNAQIIQDAIRGVPDLVMEVVSKGSSRRDRIDKKALYGQFGVKEYWIVDPEAVTIEVFGLLQSGYRLIEKTASDGDVESKLLAGFKVPVRSIRV